MFKRICEVQVDETAYEHFKYTWSILGGTPKLSTLRKTLIQKLRNDNLFNKYSLFDDHGNRLSRAMKDRFLKSNEQLSLKTRNGKSFYKQSAGNTDNVQILENIEKEQKKWMDQWNALRSTERIQQSKLQKEFEAKLKLEYAKINTKINSNSIEQSHQIILTQQCKFDEKKIVIKKMYNKYQKLYKKLKKEYDRLQKVHFEERNDPTIKELVLLGKTGDGKSTFGNRLCGDSSKLGNKGPFKASNNVKSVTQTISKSVTKINDVKVAVVDTPGIFDSDDSDWQNTVDLVKYLKGCGGVNAFIVIGKPPRLDSNFQQMIKNLMDHLGKKFCKHLIFVITHIKINMVNDNPDMKQNDDDDSDSDSDSGQDNMTPEEWLNDFACRVRGKLNLPKKPIAIGVENRNENSYKTAIQRLMNKISSKKFNCANLKSPFDTDKNILQNIYDDMQTEMKCLKNVKQTMIYIQTSIEKNIERLQQDDPAYQPSFSNLNVPQMTKMDNIDFHDVSLIDRHNQPQVVINDVYVDDKDDNKHDPQIPIMDDINNNNNSSPVNIQQNEILKSNVVTNDIDLSNNFPMVFDNKDYDIYNGYHNPGDDDDDDDDDDDAMDIDKDDIDDDDNNDDKGNDNDNDKGGNKDNDTQTNDLDDYLNSIGFGQYAQIFKENGYETLQILEENAADLTQTDLKEMGVAKMLDQKKLLKAIHKINQNQADEGAEKTGFL